MSMNPRLLRPRISGFTPRSLSGLMAWYDAADTSTITIATGVSQWNDKSGNGRNLTQSVTNNQPLHNSVTLNGKPTVTFDGTNDSLRTAFTLTQPYMFFMVYRFEDAPSNDERVMDGRAGSGLRSGEVWVASSTQLAVWAGAQLTASVGSALTAFNVWDFTFNGASSAIRLRKTAATASGNAGTNSGTGLTLGANGNGTASQWANVSIAELCVYSRVLSTADADAVRAYLGKKWNLAYLS